ncbi:TraI domain-containing protein [Cupriavidus taiwanensis]|uniref:TraI domain-containing protein n=1 Tax=Cupriavidus taiwanensis TaxID=164546 RepID=UPI0025406BD4|nr:TraI domain-containing protein [Cupriavidus taiwanensis]MDK3022954.1 TraI domain-containing protein [Cupriavidus taiwanensis]
MNQHLPQDAETLLASHSQRIALIRQYANEANPADFEAKWLAVLRACANWFSTMPLQPEQHAEPGGAFRATVEVAYFAMRLSGGQKFAADQPSERRRRLEPQYLYALFLAACCSWLDEPCRHFHFVRDDTGEQWMPAAHGAFQPWLDGNPYRVIRLVSALPVERMRSALLARSILGAESLSWLEGPVLSELFGAINPAPMPSGFEAQLHKIVRQAVAAARDYEQKARRAVFAPDPTTPPSAEQLAAAPMPGAQTASAKAVATAQAPESVAPTLSAAAGAAALFQPAAPAVPAAEPAVASPPAAAAHAAPPAAPVPAPSTSAPPAIDAAALGRSRRDTPDPFTVLLGGSRMMSEFFRALAQDVTAGKVKVAWGQKGLVLPKKMIGNYGIASDTLIDNLRKLSLLYGVEGPDLVLTERIGALILPRPNTPA